MALIMSVLHNFVNIFMHILYSFACFSQSHASCIVHLLYQNDTFSTNIVSFVYHLPRVLAILAIHRFPVCPLSCGRLPLPPQVGPKQRCFMPQDTLSCSTKTAGPIRGSRCLPHPYSFYLQVRSRRPGTRPWYPPGTVPFSTRS